MDNKLKTPTVENIQAVLKWKGKIHDRLPQKPIADAIPGLTGFAPDVIEPFKKTLLEQGFVQDFNWQKWTTKALKIFEGNPKLIAVDLLTVVRLLTFHVRKDRFCSGHFDEMIEHGHIQALLNRLDYLLHGSKPTVGRQLDACHRRYRELHRIVRAHLGEHARQLGSAWMSPTWTLRQADVLVLGLNPGARNPKNHRRIEDFTKLDVNKGGRDGHGYLADRDGKQHLLGKRLELLLDTLGVSLADVPATNLIFRLSTSAGDIEFAAEAGRCWPVHEWILDVIQPRVILSLGNSSKSAYGYIKKHVCGDDGVSRQASKSIGWGDVEVKAYDCTLQGRRVTVIGLPHLSRYDPQRKGNRACRDMIRKALRKS